MVWQNDSQSKVSFVILNHFVKKNKNVNQRSLKNFFIFVSKISGEIAIAEMIFPAFSFESKNFLI